MVEFACIFKSIILVLTQSDPPVGHGNGTKPLFYHIWACGLQVVLIVLRGKLLLLHYISQKITFILYMKLFFPKEDIFKGIFISKRRHLSSF